MDNVESIEDSRKRRKKASAKKYRDSHRKEIRDYYLKNKDYIIGKSEKYYLKNKEACKSRAKKYIEKNKETDKERHRLYFLKKKKDNLCVSCGLPAKIKSRSKEGTTTYFTNCMRCSEYRRSKREREKQEAYSILGNKCNCCGEGFEKFLTVDHVMGDGAKHRKSGLGNTRMVYREIVSLGEEAKKKYQVLCQNCNIAKWTYNKCPCKDRYNDICFRLLDGTFKT